MCGEPVKCNQNVVESDNSSRPRKKRCNRPVTTAYTRDRILVIILIWNDMGLVHGWMDDVVGVGGEREKTNQRAHGGEPRRVEHVFNLNNHPVPKRTSNRIPPTKRLHSTHNRKAPISTQRHGFAKQQREREKKENENLLTAMK